MRLLIWKEFKKEQIPTNKIAKEENTEQELLDAELYGPKWQKYEKIRQQVFERDKRICVLCGTDLELDKELWHVHHIKYKSQGGTDELENLISLCVYCHASLPGHSLVKNKDNKPISHRRIKSQTNKIISNIYHKRPDLFKNDFSKQKLDDEVFTELLQNIKIKFLKRYIEELNQDKRVIKFGDFIKVHDLERNEELIYRYGIDFSPHSPLGEALKGCTVGEIIDFGIPEKIIRTIKIMEVSDKAFLH